MYKNRSRLRLGIKHSECVPTFRAERLSWNFGVPLLLHYSWHFISLDGIVGNAFSKPNAEPPAWAITLMIVFPSPCMVAMALCIPDSMGLFVSKACNSHFGRPHIARRLMLFLSFACLLLFDILFNTGLH